MYECQRCKRIFMYRPCIHGEYLIKNTKIEYNECLGILDYCIEIVHSERQW